MTDIYTNTQDTESLSLSDEVKVVIRKLSEIVEGYSGTPEVSTVSSMNGLLSIRPTYQREFVYDAEKQLKVVDSVLKGYPIGIFYFIERKNGTYEVLDGQQRILSLCQFMGNKEANLRIRYDNSVAETDFAHLPAELRLKMENYSVIIYVLPDDKKKCLEWFKAVNIEGTTMTDQEMRSAVHNCKFVQDAKLKFVSRDCYYSKNFVGYVSNSSYTRQKLLETALDWEEYYECALNNIAVPKSLDERVIDCLIRHRDDRNAAALTTAFETIIDWAKKLFPADKCIFLDLNKQNWGALYAEFYKQDYSSRDIAAECQAIWNDISSSEARTTKANIIRYVLMDKSTDEKLASAENLLNRREFSVTQKHIMYLRQGGLCGRSNTRNYSEHGHGCGKYFPESEMHGDHIVPWSNGGKTVLDNLQMLCSTCNEKKGNK